MSRYIDDQNNRIWSAEKPLALHAHPLRLVIGEQYLKNKLWDHCAWKRQLLWKIIQIFLLNLLLEENKQDCWFQQIEVTTYTVTTAAAFLWDFFSDHIVRYGLWPP